MSDTAVSIPIERAKVVIDYIKFILTLSTGSIVLITTFLEKIFVKPTTVWLVIVCLICFLVTILGGLIFYTLLVFPMNDETLLPDNKINIMIVTTPIMWITFFLALLSLTIFAIINISHL